MRNPEPRRTGPRALCLLALLLIGGCASTNVPDRWLQSPKGTVPEPYGGWVEVKTGDSVIAGELIAVSPETLYIADPVFTAVPVAGILTARLVSYQADNMAGAVVIGTLSTLANGWYLVFTMPLWLIGGSIAAGSRSREPMIDYPDEPLKRFAPYARYPAGMVPGLDRNAVLRKLSRKAP